MTCILFNNVIKKLLAEVITSANVLSFGQASCLIIL